MRIVAALAVQLALVGCDQPSPEAVARQKAASLEYARHVAALPVKPPSGKATMREIAEIFAKGCLPNFDDVNATLADLKRAGLTAEEKLEWDAGENGLHSDAMGITASMGLRRYGERTFGNVCEVHGEVRDPQSDPIAALQAFVGGLEFDPDGNTLVTRGKDTFRVHVGAPQLSAEVPGLNNAGAIADLDLTNPNYWKGAHRRWGSVYFSVDWAPK